MQRAAAGLAAVCAGLLPRVYGARVVVLAGSGDNGGDALYAGPGWPAAAPGGGGRRGLAGARGRRRPRCGPRAGGIAAPRTGACRPRSHAADLILDGLLGIGGRGGLREPQAPWPGWRRGAPAARGGRGGPAERDGRGHRRGRREPRSRPGYGHVRDLKPGLLIDPGAAHAGVVELVDIGLGTVPGRARPRRACRPPTWPRGCPGPPTESDKYRRGVLGDRGG